MCLMEGKTLSPEVAGTCNLCSLYLNTCLPIVTNNGWVFGECDNIDYCMECVVYEECYRIMKGAFNHEEKNDL